MSPFRSPLREALPPIDPGHVPESMRPHIAAIRRAGRLRRVTGFVVGLIFYGSLLALASFVAWFFVQATDREMPSQTTVEIVTPVTGPGDDLEIRVRPRRLRSCEGKVLFRAWDRVGNVINQSETAWNFPIGDAAGFDKPFLRKLRISRDAVASTQVKGVLSQDGRLRIERKFFCNPVQKWLGWPIVGVLPEMIFGIQGEPRL